MNTLKEILSSSCELCDRANGVLLRLNNINETLTGPCPIGILAEIGENHAHLHNVFQQSFEVLSQIEKALDLSKQNSRLEGEAAERGRY